MNRALSILGIILLCGLAGVALVTMAIHFGVPNYYRDSGSPPLILGTFLGCPLGAVVGLVVATFLALRRKE